MGPGAHDTLGGQATWETLNQRLADMTAYVLALSKKRLREDAPSEMGVRIKKEPKGTTDEQTSSPKHKRVKMEPDFYTAADKAADAMAQLATASVPRSGSEVASVARDGPSSQPKKQCHAVIQGGVRCPRRKHLTLRRMGEEEVLFCEKHRNGGLEVGSVARDGPLPQPSPSSLTTATTQREKQTPTMSADFVRPGTRSHCTQMRKEAAENKYMHHQCYAMISGVRCKGETSLHPFLDGAYLLCPEHLHMQHERDRADNETIFEQSGSLTCGHF